MFRYLYPTYMLPESSVIVLTSATGKFNYLSTRSSLVGYKTF